MGYLTTITVHNDKIHSFREDPKQFGKDILDGMDKAYQEGKSYSVRGGDIVVQPSRHADDTTLYLHWGNMVKSVNGYSKDFQLIIQNNPKLAEQMLDQAERIIKQSKKMLEEQQNKTI